MADFKARWLGNAVRYEAPVLSAGAAGGDHQLTLTAVATSHVIVRMATEPILHAGHSSLHAVRKRLAQVNIECRSCLPHCFRRNRGCNSSDREAIYAQSCLDRDQECSVEVAQGGIL
jgi:hypothetical protein